MNRNVPEPQQHLNTAPSSAAHPSNTNHTTTHQHHRSQPQNNQTTNRGSGRSIIMNNTVVIITYTARARRFGHAVCTLEIISSTSAILSYFDLSVMVALRLGRIPSMRVSRPSALSSQPCNLKPFVNSWLRIIDHVQHVVSEMPCSHRPPVHPQVSRLSPI